MVNDTWFTDEPALVCLPPPEDDDDEKEKHEVKNLAEPTAKLQTRITPCLKNFKVLEDFECKDSYDSNIDKSTFLVTPLSNSKKDECLTPGDDIEFLLHHDPSTPIKSVASILEGFIDEPPFEENDDLFDLECKTNDWKKILYDAQIDEPECFDPKGDNDEIDAFLAIEVSNVVDCGKLSFSRVAENSHTIIESLPTSTTLIEDSDSHREEIDIFSRPDDLIPPGIESDFDLEDDIIDNLLNDDPIPEYERLIFDMEPDVPMINNVDELNEDECFDPGGGEINVEVDNSFIFVVRTFLPYLTYPEVSPLLSSTENEDTIFDPGIFAFHFSSQQPVVVKCFMEFCFSTLSPRTNEFGDRVKLCDSVTKNKALRGRHPMLILLSSFLFLL
ncbi:hypothetical protein Tco_0424776 [Tanacetum coccineum]